MADWYLAPSLVALRNEINARWPNRDKASDGSVGDTAHSARKSDHNPDWDSGGVVRAIDVDKDGINVEQLLGAVVRDHRVAYVIWNRQIASATEDGNPWDWEPYNGSNPHDKHIHISIKHSWTAENDQSRWFTNAESEEMFTVDQYNNIIKFLVTISGNLAVLMQRELADDASKNAQLAELEALIRAHS